MTRRLRGTRRLILGGWVGLLLLPAPASVMAERLPVRFYTTRDGLSSSTVLSLTGDSHGFVWLATRDGLNRYDGERFVSYAGADGLPVPTVNHLLESSAGDYWIATNGGGVARFDPRRHVGEAAAPAFRIYKMGEGFAVNRVNRVHEDGDGVIWAATDDGLLRLDPARMQSFERVPLGLPGVHGVPVFRIVSEADGTLLLVTTAGLVQRFRDGRTASYDVQPAGSDRTFRLLIDSRDDLWIARRANPGLFRIRRRVTDPAGYGLPLDRLGDAERVRSREWFDQPVLDLYQTRDGQIWFCTSGGIVVHDGRDFRRLGPEHGLPETPLTMTEDLSGNVWMVGRGRGVAKLTRQGMTSYDENDGLRDTEIHTLLAGPAGPYVVSGDWWVQQFDGKRFASAVTTRPAGETPPYASQVVYRGKRSGWWVLARRELLRFDPATPMAGLTRRPATVIAPPGVFERANPIRLFEDSSGVVWIGLRGPRLNDDDILLARWSDDDEPLRTYGFADGLPRGFIPGSFAEDGTGGIWIGSRGSGLVRHTEGGFTAIGGLPGGHVQDLHLDAAGRLWVATSAGGLSRLDRPDDPRPRLTRYSTTDGLSSDNIRCITEDAWGRIYAGTARGVDRIDVETGRIEHFSADEGLASEFTTAALRDGAGNIWIGTQDGVSRLVPEPPSPRAVPAVRIAGFEVNGRPYALPLLGLSAVGPLRLRPDEKQIRIDYFGIGSGLRYEHRLEGAAADWSQVGEQRRVDLSNLSAGQYRFLVRVAGSADDATPAAPGSVTFRVLQPVWRRPWFMILASLLLAGLVYGAYRARLSRLLELERLRTRIATDLHDDIGASLSRIAVLSEVARRRLGAEQPSVAAHLATIAEASREIVDSMSDIVWAINPRRDRLSDLTQRMRRLASDLFTSRDVDFSFRVPDLGLDTRLRVDVRRQVFLVFKEAVNNVVRHSRCCRADIELRIDRRCLVLRIEDDGRGFGVDDVDGHGLGSMRRRAAEMGGALHVASISGRGTTITLTVPLPRT